MTLIRDFRKGTWAGFLGPLIGLSFVLLAIVFAPDFSWESDALSHLGHWFRTDIGPNPFVRALIFNSGLVVGGILIIYFTIDLIRQMKDVIIKLALLSIIVNALFLAAVGVFSENISGGHIIAALGFFLSIPVSLILVGIGFLQNRNSRKVGIVLVGLGILSIILFRPWASIAVWEYSMALVSTIAVVFIDGMDILGHLEPVKRQFERSI